MFSRKNFLTYALVCLILFGLGLYSVFVNGTLDPSSGNSWCIIFIPLVIAVLLMLGYIRDRKRAKDAAKSKKKK